MIKKRTKFLFDLIVLSTLLIHTFGLKYTLNLFFEMLV